MPYYENPRPEVARLLPPEYERLLEVGCGAGAFSANFKPGTESWGVEPTSAANEARDRFARVLEGRYGDVEHQIPDGYFDVVVCNDVIEHVEDHATFLQSVRRKLRPGGRLVASVPNMRYIKALIELLWAKDWRYVDQGILDRTHLRFFTEKSLRRAVQEAGFELEHIGGINSALTDVRGMKSFAKAIACALSIGLTLGWWADTRFQQFALRATRVG